jgi:hypothetical protein
MLVRATRCALCAVGGALALVSCALPVETPQPYATEQNLCAAEQAEEWQAQVARCRQQFDLAKSCGGVISFSGSLEGEDVTVDSELSGTEFADLSKADASKVRVDINLYGRSPYFGFNFIWRAVGGKISGERLERTLRLEPAFDSLDDEFVRGAFRVNVGGESKAFAARTGMLVITRQHRDEEVATFQATFGTAGDELSGCFHAFGVQRKLTREAVPDAAF